MSEEYIMIGDVECQRIDTTIDEAPPGVILFRDMRNSGSKSSHILAKIAGNNDIVFMYRLFIGQEGVRGNVTPDDMDGVVLRPISEFGDIDCHYYKKKE